MKALLPFALMCLFGFSVGAAELTRGPYLQMVTTHSILVRYRTDEPLNTVVQFGTSADNLISLATEAGESTDHEIRLGNLSPNTKYFYRIRHLRAFLTAAEGHFFVTAPAGPKPTRIWAIGDSGTEGTGLGNATGVRDAYYRYTGPRSTDVWLLLGDNAYYSGLEEEYDQAFFKVYPEMLRQTAVWGTIGNHEAYAPAAVGRIPWFDIFSLPTRGEAGGEPSGTENYYSFNYSNIHFVCLDSMISDRTPRSPMLQWLEKDLAANTAAWLIAFFHHPPYTKGSHDSDFEIEHIQMRRYAVPILEAHGVDLVLSGHSHSYERSYFLNGHYGFSRDLTPAMIRDSGSGRTNETGAYQKSAVGPVPNEGAVYVVAGSSGWTDLPTGSHPAMFTAEIETGSLVLDVDGDRLDGKFLRETGAVDDSFTLIKGRPAQPFRLAVFRISNGNVTASWKSIAGRSYLVQRSLSLEKPKWVAVDAPITAAGATTTWWAPVDPDSGKSFYRVTQLDGPAAQAPRPGRAR